MCITKANRYHLSIIRYKKSLQSKYIILASSLLLLCISFLISLSIGTCNIQDVLSSLINSSQKYYPIIMEIRLPRTVCATLVGAGMGLAGSILQSILKNPLASPFTLGIGSGAGFGAVVTILLYSSASPYMYALGAFFFAMVSTLFILITGKIKGSSVETVILAGIAQMYFFSALTSFAQYVSSSEQIHQMILWFFGNLEKPGWKEISLMAIMVLIPFPYFFLHSMDYDILLQGDEVAMALGVRAPSLRMKSIVLTSFITAGCICFTGIIGFIGLVAPHIARMCIGSNHRFLVPLSSLLGAIIVLWADIVGRCIWRPQIIPIGIMTSFIGVPFFVYLLFRKKREYWR